MFVQSRELSTVQRDCISTDMNGRTVGIILDTGR